MQEGDPLLRSDALEAGQAAAREIAALHVERPAHRLAAPDRDDARPCRQRVQPLGRGCHACADDRHLLAVLVRLVGVDGSRVAGELLGNGEPRMAECEQYVLEHTVAVELEASTEKHNITPGPIVTARELLGDMLLEAGQPGPAAEAYEASLRVAPNRFKALHGVARAAERAGDRGRASAYYGKLLATAAAADTERAELQEAKAFK